MTEFYIERYNWIIDNEGIVLIDSCDEEPILRYEVEDDHEINKWRIRMVEYLIKELDREYNYYIKLVKSYGENEN